LLANKLNGLLHVSQAAGDFGKEPFYQMLGYFSLIGLCRLHCILGDYYQALKVLDNIDLSKKVRSVREGGPLAIAVGNALGPIPAFVGCFRALLFPRLR
jgi:hypothetical protein